MKALRNTGIAGIFAVLLPLLPGAAAEPFGEGKADTQRQDPVVVSPSTDRGAPLDGTGAGKTLVDAPPPPDSRKPANVNGGNKPVFVYQPPSRGAPSSREGGGTRSVSQLTVLAPDHVALSSHARPRLYWYIATGFRTPPHFWLRAAGATTPLLEISLPPQPNGGIAHLDLAQHGVRLEPDTVYEWGVSLAPPPHQRWPPLVSAASILLGDADPRLDDAEPTRRPYLSAERGLWYDALDEVSRLAGQAGGAPFWRLERAKLLKQVGLVEAAQYEHNAALRER